MIDPPPPPGVGREEETALPRGPQALGRPAAVSLCAELTQLAPPGGLYISSDEWGANNWVEFIQMKTSC